MRAIVTGGTGLIGRLLVTELVKKGHEVVVLTRNTDGKADLFPKGVILRQWDTKTANGWGDLVNRETALINLAGEGVVNWRWTNAHRQRVLQSRLDTSQAMLDAVKSATEKPKVLLQASAVGYYGSRGDESISEHSKSGSGWRADVCIAWEAATEPVEAEGVRRAILRIGIVLDMESGALPPMVLGARFMGGQLGDGQQWVPWIHNLDVALSTIHLMENDNAHGIFNLVAPHPVTNKTMMATLGKVLRWPTFISVPAFALNLALGEMATSVLDSQRIYPPVLLQSGYEFQYAELEPALRDLLK